MPKTLLTALLILGSCGIVLADEASKREPITQKTPDQLPDGIERFNGVLVGRLVSKDIEKGTFVMNVDAIPRVWRNSKAEKPKRLIGKNVVVDGVFGKWLDVLLLVKPEETVECEARHDGGNSLTFPGELLRKVAPFEPGDYPVLPEEFRGFNGAVLAKVIHKDPDQFEMVVEVKKVGKIWDNNKAKDPKSIEGKQMMLAGFWRRQEAYHKFKVGDEIEVGVEHISRQSDHVTVAEFVRKADADGESEN